MMAAFSHNGEPGSALDAELKGRDTRHMEGYSAGFKAGREAGMREAAMIVRDGLIDREDIEDDDVVEAINGVINDSADAILSAIGGGK